MAIRNIREIGDGVLNKKCKEVKEMTPRTKELIEDMLETMYEANGVGLAAPQVGISLCNGEPQNPGSKRGTDRA